MERAEAIASAVPSVARLFVKLAKGELSTEGSIPAGPSGCADGAGSRTETNHHIGLALTSARVSRASASAFSRGLAAGRRGPSCAHGCRALECPVSCGPRGAVRFSFTGRRRMREDVALSVRPRLAPLCVLVGTLAVNNGALLSRPTQHGELIVGQV